MGRVTTTTNTQPVPPDIDIAEAAELTPIVDLARDQLGIDPAALVPYGHTKAKISLEYVNGLADRPEGRLVLVTAISPTPAGEGKTTTSVGLADALSSLGEKAMVALREPSMGPVFGMKGGAAGGGYAQVVPMTDINLNFTGDFAAIAAANNLLSALLDNHVHHGNALGIDPRTVTWKRVVDLNDRALRDIVVGLGGVANGNPREDGFDIVVASEVMAILCLATSISDLRERLGDVVVGYTRDKKPVTARDLKANGAMTVILRDALAPNLVQTLEHTPAMIHGGPFANIAHGCNSVMATRTALKLADYVVTEAGFGADLGAEKFIDIKCRQSGLRPSAVVVVATVRALKYHGGMAVADLKEESVEALTEGMANLRRHLRNVRDVYGLPAVVALNRFPTDTDAEVAALLRLVEAEGFRAYEATHYSDGGAGAQDLARGVLDAIENDPGEMQLVYPTTLARREGRGGGDPRLRRGRGDLRRQGGQAARGDRGGGLRPPARLHGQDAGLVLHRPHPARGALDHTVHVREVRLAAGAGFVVMVTGDIMTMPGLPKVPASEHIDVDENGRIVGLG